MGKKQQPHSRGNLPASPSPGKMATAWPEQAQTGESALSHMGSVGGSPSCPVTRRLLEQPGKLHVAPAPKTLEVMETEDLRSGCHHGHPVQHDSCPQEQAAPRALGGMRAILGSAGGSETRL